MDRAQRRANKARKLRKVGQWAKEQAHWLTERELRIRAKSTLGSGRNRHYAGNRRAEQEAAMREQEQLEDVELEVLSAEPDFD